MHVAILLVTDFVEKPSYPGFPTWLYYTSVEVHSTGDCNPIDILTVTTKNKHKLTVKNNTNIYCIVKKYILSNCEIQGFKHKS